MKTNNTKVIDKEYLAKQLYIYDKKYIKPLDSGKQKNIEITSKHITFEDGYKLGMNISNENEAKNNDYLRLSNSENGVMEWKTPKDEIDYIEDANNDTLVTAKALANFKGSNNIKIVGDIVKGNWKVGNISIAENDLDFGKINFNVDADEKELVISAEDDDWKIKSAADFDFEKLSASEITIGDTKITEEKIETNNITFGKVSLTTDGDNLKIVKEDGAYIDFSATPAFLKEIKTSKENGLGYLMINDFKYTIATDLSSVDGTNEASIEKLVNSALGIDSQQQSQS